MGVDTRKLTVRGNRNASEIDKKQAGKPRDEEKGDAVTDFAISIIKW